MKAIGFFIAVFVTVVSPAGEAGDSPAPIMTLSNACHLVSNARRVILGGYTLARCLTRVEGAFWGIYNRSDAGAVFDNMLDGASPAGKAYCLTGLRDKNPDRFRYWAARLSQATNQFDMQISDFITPLRLSGFVGIVEGVGLDIIVTNLYEWLSLPNHTSDGIRQPADVLPKPSM